MALAEGFVAVSVRLSRACHVSLVAFDTKALVYGPQGHVKCCLPMTASLTICFESFLMKPLYIVCKAFVIRPQCRLPWKPIQSALG